MADTIHIRAAGIDDVEPLRTLIRELAVYEKLLDEVSVTTDDLRELLFSERPAAEAIMVCDGKEPVGFAVFYTTASTFSGKPGIYIEDVFVRPAHRGRGCGKAMLAHVARIAGRRGCDRLSWQVLDWNKSSIEFYEHLGARRVNEWLIYKLTGHPLARLQNNTEPTQWV